MDPARRFAEGAPDHMGVSALARGKIPAGLANKSPRRSLKKSESGRSQPPTEGKIMRITTCRARSLSMVVAVASMIFVTDVSRAAETGEAFIIPLFPQKQADLKKGLPPG